MAFWSKIAFWSKKGKCKKGQSDAMSALRGAAAVGLTFSAAGAAVTSGAVFYNPGHGPQPPTGENFFATSAFITTGAASLGVLIGTSFQK